MLAVENVSVAFGGVKAVQDVSFSLGEGETLGLVGPNGAGKTTLFNVISGVAVPSAGRIVFQGEALSREPDWRRARRGIGRTFQIPQPMHELTVRENLLVAQRFGAGRSNPARLDEILDLIGLKAHQHRDAATSLSLTEQKALEVGKALATEPVLLLLDEVMGGLETATKRAFAAMLAAVRERYRLAVVVIEHDIETIVNLCPRAVVLNYGKVIADGPPRAVFDDPEVVRSYTGDAGAALPLIEEVA
ncbi:MAG TPA: ABC transporter ATP-binding protein [Beijerinckiaceae bacterium]|jgi:branched-chain amino acid transport system ATP-binding protein